MEEYLSIFVDDEYPSFVDKYLKTNTLNRLKNVTQFCGCDYTKLYNPRFLYTRYDHSLVVAHMTWHFTKNKRETIAALLHDTGTPCFAHCIDYVFGDYMNQESSERKITDVITEDKELLGCIETDGLSLKDFEDFSMYHILENKSPQLCTDRLDGVLGTCYVWLHTHSLNEIKEVYDNIETYQNEYGYPEIGFKDLAVAEKFVQMIYNYAKELQGNTDKYVMKYISEIVKSSVEKKLITLDDLYAKEEKEICDIFSNNFYTWKEFNEATQIVREEEKPNDMFCISFDTKKRNTIPLIATDEGNRRVIDVSDNAKKNYEYLSEYKDSKYAYLPNIEEII